MSKSSIIIALDYNNPEHAFNMVDMLDDLVSIYKVGLELFLNDGDVVIDELHKRNKQVFLDLKFHDIPNTVAQACEYALSKNVFMFNVHASGGMSMLQAVADTVRNSTANTFAIGVTILTSLDEYDTAVVYHTADISTLTHSLATMTHTAGLHGVVCAAQEASLMKQTFGNTYITVCPGIRLADEDTQDQKRTMTPYKASKLGADYLVMGRSITANKNPVEQTQKILQNLQRGSE